MISVVVEFAGFALPASNFLQLLNMAVTGSWFSLPRIECRSPLGLVPLDLIDQRRYLTL